MWRGLRRGQAGGVRKDSQGIVGARMSGPGLGVLIAFGLYGCTPSVPQIDVVGLPRRNDIELPTPGEELNGVISCGHPLRGGCVFTIAAQ